MALFTPRERRLGRKIGRAAARATATNGQKGTARQDRLEAKAARLSPAMGERVQQKATITYGRKMGEAAPKLRSEISNYRTAASRMGIAPTGYRMRARR